VIRFREFRAGTQTQPPAIVTEYAGNGSLSAHLPLMSFPRDLERVYENGKNSLTVAVRSARQKGRR
jgi:hypothetical protein